MRQKRPKTHVGEKMGLWPDFCQTLVATIRFLLINIITVVYVYNIFASKSQGEVKGWPMSTQEWSTNDQKRILQKRWDFGLETPGFGGCNSFSPYKCHHWILLLQYFCQQKSRWGQGVVHEHSGMKQIWPKTHVAEKMGFRSGNAQLWWLQFVFS